MKSAEELLDRATLAGYIAGLAGNEHNPYHYMQSEAWAWQHGYDQGVAHSRAAAKAA